MRWLIERQLKATAAKLRSAREDLDRLGYEVDSFSHDADDLKTLAIASSRVDAERDYEEADQQTRVLRKAQADLRVRIAHLVEKQDALLDKMGAR